MAVIDYLRATRCPFTLLPLATLLQGVAYAFRTCPHVFHWARVGIAFAGMLFIALGANLLNDWSDSSETDACNPNHSPFNGGSRVLIDGSLSHRALLSMILVCFASALVLGFGCVWWGYPQLLWIGGIGVLGAVAYSLPPLALMRRGLGELIVLICFGPLLSLGTFYVMTQQITLNAALIGLPQGLLAMMILLVNQIPDYAADKATGKQNLTVRYGVEKSRLFAFSAMVFAWVVILTNSLWVIHATTTLYLMIFMPVFFRLFRQIAVVLEKRQAITSLQGKLIALTVGVGFLNAIMVCCTI